MDKRKANGAETPENDDRALKRRKLVEDYDLSKGESRESTSAYGLNFLEQIRRTADKNGRRVSVYFEELPARGSNHEYYKRTRMPISLGMVESKLKNGEFKNLSELESYLKRMIQNAKEFYPRSSSTFDDAERVRKAVSNYMTKTNPAYQKRGYQAVPTPLPPEDGEEGEDADDNEGSAKDENPGEDENADGEDQEKDASAVDGEEVTNEDAGTGRSSRKRSIILKRRGSARHKPPPSPYTTTSRRASARFEAQVKESEQQDEEQGEDEGEEEEAPDVEAEEKEDDDAEAEEDEEEDEDEDEEPVEEDGEASEDSGYEGLTFQQAQEKFIEDLLQHTEPDFDSPYFEPFINLPPRALKDYYRMIQEPISVRKLQRMVKGIHGRSNEATGVSEFKTWAQFEEKAKLLWTNAYYYNEEGSEIYELAQELEAHVKKQLKQATAVVPDPAPPKIKLKIGQQGTEQPTPAKKITIHVGNGRGASTEVLTPLTRESVDTPSVNEATTAATQTTAVSIEERRSVSAAVASPSQSGLPQKSEEATATASPAPRPTSAASDQLTPAAQPAPPAAPVPPPAPVIPMEEKHPRLPGKTDADALISNIRFFASHYANQSDRPVMVSVLPDPKEMQQSVTINVPPTHTRVGMITRLPEALQDRQYSLWTLLDKQPLQPNHQLHPGQHSSERIFEATLHPGLNVIESHLVAAIPKAERVPGGPEIELEIITIYVNVMRN